MLANLLFAALLFALLASLLGWAGIIIVSDLLDPEDDDGRP